MRLIDFQGKNLGVFSQEEALSKAKEEQKDLIEIAPQASPPVVKLIEYSKFLYQEEKRRRDQKRNAKRGETKEIRFSPFIAENDYRTRLGKIKKILSSGNKVKLVVRFQGRQMSKSQFGYDLINRIVQDLGEVRIEQEPKFIGLQLFATIVNTKKSE